MFRFISHAFIGSTKYYQKKKLRLQKKARERYQTLYKEEKKRAAIWSQMI